MMRRVTAFTLAAALLGGLFAIPATPAGAQNGGSMLDAPRLGFEIDPKAGNVGDTVGAQVNPADVQEHCHATVDEMREALGPWGTSYSATDTSSAVPPEVLATQWNAIATDLYGLGIPDNWEQLLDAWFAFWSLTVPLPPSPNYPAWYGEGPTQEWWFDRVLMLNNSRRIDQPFVKTPEQYAATYLPMWVFALIGQNLADAADQVFDQTFVLTFVDPTSQQMVGDMGQYDPNTGLGAIDVPDLEPGLWAIAGACVELQVTPETVSNAVAAAVELFETHDMLPAPGETGRVWEFCMEPRGAPPQGGTCELHWGEVILTAIVPELAVPRALGIDFYCILNDEGFCATPPDAVGLLAELSEEELAEFADLEAGDGAGNGDAGPDGLTVEPVSASPAFTG